MRELEVDGAVAEIQASEAEVRAVQPRVLPLASLVPCEIDERGSLAEGEQAAGTEQTRDLGQCHARIAEAHRAVVAEDDVERRVPEGHCLPAGGDERDRAGGRAPGRAPGV